MKTIMIFWEVLQKETSTIEFFLSSLKPILSTKKVIYMIIFLCACVLATITLSKIAFCFYLFFTLFDLFNKMSLLFYAWISHFLPAEISVQFVKIIEIFRKLFFLSVSNKNQLQQRFLYVSFGLSPFRSLFFSHIPSVLQPLCKFQEDYFIVNTHTEQCEIY